jgi:hypothetical protein
VHRERNGERAPQLGHINVAWRVGQRWRKSIIYDKKQSNSIEETGEGGGRLHNLSGCSAVPVFMLGSFIR